MNSENNDRIKKLMEENAQLKTRLQILSEKRSKRQGKVAKALINEMKKRKVKQIKKMQMQRQLSSESECENSCDKETSEEESNSRAKRASNRRVEVKDFTIEELTTESPVKEQ